ncbi:hypothetical protein GCM10027217_25180 [Pseudomaricurvus hydrocarbonicus]
MDARRSGLVLNEVRTALSNETQANETQVLSGQTQTLSNQTQVQFHNELW